MIFIEEMRVKFYNIVIFLLIIAWIVWIASVFLGWPNSNVPVIFVKKEFIEKKSSILKKNKEELKKFNNFLRKKYSEKRFWQLEVNSNGKIVDFTCGFNDCLEEKRFKRKEFNTDKFEVEKILKKLEVDKIEWSDNSDEITYYISDALGLREIESVMIIFRKNEADYSEREIRPVWKIVRKNIDNKIFILEQCHRNNCNSNYTWKSKIRKK